jgi:hypothetical protein
MRNSLRCAINEFMQLTKKRYDMFCRVSRCRVWCSLVMKVVYEQNKLDIVDDYIL